ncbi:E3 ubiquitin-protein ligase TRIM39-like [Cheilinus undulatus]|uniref:E3 ubiquitin-protein ligase TRIM39-like n=1 Tax=Cheilinus undulatus TaxID=241271 RepID=UPI001BD1C440|nr:E3 ubiquitin-protein ligase TRIM39-like [Cheilinus undulatus]
MTAVFPHAEDDYFCSVCSKVFNNPVLLSCSHSFCKDCLELWWVDKPLRPCPLCRAPSTGEPHRNLALKNLCDSFLKHLSLEDKTSETETVCSLHSEKLRLFCLDHQQPVCVVCRDSRAHTNHRFRPINEAADDYKEELRKHLKLLQDRIEHFNKVKVEWDQTAAYIKTQALDTEKQIKEMFKKLHKFLEEEEKARVAAVRREEEEKSSEMKIKIHVLTREIASLSKTIKATEKELKSGSVTFFNNYKAAVERAKQRPLVEDPQLGPGALIDVAKHLGNLSFNVWNKMKEMVTYSTVVLDPSTAGLHLFVSEDLKSLRFTQRDYPPLKNPERVEGYPMVLGSEGFNSGTHSWDVEVRSDADWAVGVIAESVSRKGDIQSGFWEVQFFDGKYRAYAPPMTDTILSVDQQLQKIRVKLGWSRGKLSFYDLDMNTHLHTFYQIFNKRLFPFVSTINKNSLSIVPKKFKVQIEI